MSRQIIRYSEAFKMQVISELESGKLGTVTEARTRYSIRGAATVQSWLREYGKNHLRSKVITVQPPQDRDQVKAQKKRIRDLEKALADTQVKAVLSEAYYQIVCEHHGITDPEAYKKTGREAVGRGLNMKSGIAAVNTASLCRGVGMTRANWYKVRKHRKRRRIDDELIVELVKQERQVQPRIGGRKLHEVLESELRDFNAWIGRDRFFNVLRENELLVPQLPRSSKTTNSRHTLPIVHNLVKDMEPTEPNQIWVSDITYIRIEDSFVYLSLIMDRFSRKIVGSHCGNSLEAIGCIHALEEALKSLPPDCTPIHHSDRGCQYCCHDYVKLLTDRGLGISMTEEHHCAENAHAERLNGILKQEYGLHMTFNNIDHARRAVKQAIGLYNHRRLHTSLEFRTPAEVHNMKAA